MRVLAGLENPEELNERTDGTANSDVDTEGDRRSEFADNLNHSKTGTSRTPGPLVLV